MGYETQFIVGKETDLNFEGTNFFSVYATIDMCKMGYDSPLYELDHKMDKGEKPRVHWYAPTGDGDTAVTEDCYGDIPKPVPITDVVCELRELVKKDDYRRFKWALGLLEAMADDAENLSVLFWGH